ncbi:MAG TPA: M28 family peptidase [Thermoleophilaceae bacterium]
MTRTDIEALCAIARGSATAGERQSAEWIAGRLERIGAHDVRLASFRYQPSWADRQLPHFAAGVLAAALKSRTLALGTLASFALEFSGRAQWLARVMPAGEGTNVVATLPAAGEPRRHLVLVAHHDAARSGLMWHPALVRHSFRHALDRGRVDSFALPPSLALAAVATGTRAGRALGGAVLALGSALAAGAARGAVVPGANDNATGVAAVLALAGRFAAEPLPGTDVTLLFPGCEEAGMGGMAHWLAQNRGRLDPGATLVLGLDTLAAGEPCVLTGEALPHTVHYRAEDLALADLGAERAGTEQPRRLRLGAWTDPILAVYAGLPAILMLSIGPEGFGPYHRLDDTPERVDWRSVDSCLRLAEGIARAFAGL